MRLGCVGCNVLPRCAVASPHLCLVLEGGNNRSKFNMPLGVEAQGFCVIR